VSVLEERIPVGVAAATGAVGQRFVSLLQDHPWFEVTVVTASERSAGQTYRDAVRWVIPGDVPASVADLPVRETTIDAFDEVAVVFSALPAEAARELEPQWAARGYVVCTNASAMRMIEDVPLLIPEINADHIDLIAAQRARRGWDGLIVASPNCSTTGIVFPMAALHRAFGLATAHAVTMQAISGAGYPGVASMDILDNIIPYIGGEEDKLEHEPNKLLGTLQGDHIEMAPFKVSAQTHRVPVMDGHLAALSIGLREKHSPDEVLQVLRSYRAPDVVADLPTGLTHPMIVRDEVDRPQPRRDRDAEDGMAITVGRVQRCAVLDVKLVSLVHNTLRGAASGAILNAELLAACGYVEYEGDLPGLP